MNEQDMMTAILKRRLGELEMEIIQRELVIAQRDEELLHRAGEIQKLNALLQDTVSQNETRL
ncbi:hypothetical protein [Agrobacterium pusense]|uniref:Uncharacterized protein n=1 Tax=Agrobacterium pusense TaxID=648995 RepID=A0AA44J2I2_9HYPH|nr:hypothetical protein [Agrobacterium pusense]NRF12175.1 hypothetical protein [Agrobacterium pusense]NRF22885.1 hypothetical protein [Agrobacterium pusense]